ncbi:MAG: DUF1501 domain-containing protein, partial [Planctomycetia bacterium]|nr:DUF1501 domain-containing protein [Planctomycetia bacterium]
MTLLDRALSRRECLKASLAGLLAPAASGWLPQLALRAGETRTSKQAKACILLWMDGGPSQIHTFNIPDKGADNRQYDTIATSVPGIHLSEHLPKLSASLKDLVIVRSMATGLNNHGAGQYLMHTGYRANQAIDYPTLGAIVARENGDRDLSLPSFINLGANGTTKPYHRAGFLGAEFAPLNLAGSSITNQRSAVDEARTADRFQLLQDVQQSALEQFRHDAVKAHLSSYERAWRLMRSDKTAALDFKKEPQAILDLYGPSG